MKPFRYRRNRKPERRLEEEQARAIAHPLRLRILELHRRSRGRSLSVEALTAALRRAANIRT